MKNFTKSRQEWCAPCTAARGHGPAHQTRAPPWWDGTLASTLGSPMYTRGSGTQDGVNLGTAVRVVPSLGDRRRRRTWTHTRPWIGRGAHAVEFSKTVAPARAGRSCSRARLGAVGRFPGRTEEYSITDVRRSTRPPRAADETAFPGRQGRERLLSADRRAAGLALSARPAD